MRGNVCPTDYNAAVPLDKQCFGDNPVIRKVPAEGCGLLRGDQWVRQDFQYFLIIFSKLGVHYPPPRRQSPRAMSLLASIFPHNSIPSLEGSVIYHSSAPEFDLDTR